MNARRLTAAEDPTLVQLCALLTAYWLTVGHLPSALQAWR